MTGAVPCHEPEANEARSQPTPYRSNQSDNAAPCGYAALGWSASTWRLQIGLNNLPGITSTPATQPLSKRPLSVDEPLTRSFPRAGSVIAVEAVFYGFVPALFWDEWTRWLTKDHGASKLARWLKNEWKAAKRARSRHIAISVVLGVVVLGVVGMLIWGFGDLFVLEP